MTDIGQTTSRRAREILRLRATSSPGVVLRRHPNKPFDGRSSYPLIESDLRVHRAIDVREMCGKHRTRRMLTVPSALHGTRTCRRAGATGYIE